MTSEFDPDAPLTKMLDINWHCPFCRLRVALFNNRMISPSASAFIREHLTNTHDYDATAVRAELDRFVRSLTL